MTIRKKEKVSPAKAVEMLRKEGVDVSLEEAHSILEFLRIIAKIAVNQYLRHGDG
jgi:hypothetical protein